MFGKIEYYYDNSLWSLQRVWNVVGKSNGITEEEYNQRMSEMKPFNPDLLMEFEKGEEHEDDVSECVGGCPVK